MSDSSAPTLLLVSADLMLGGQVNTSAKAAGFTIDRCLSTAKANEKLAANKYPVVVLELGLDGLDLAAVKAAAGDATVIGFAGHVRTELLEAAQQAGVTAVTNGQMHAQGEAIFRKLRDQSTAS